MSDVTPPPPPPEPPRPPHGSPDPAAPPAQPPADDPSYPAAPPAYAPPPAPPSAPLYGEPTYPQPSVPVYGDPGYPQMPGPAYGSPAHPQAPGEFAHAAPGVPQPIGLRPLRGIGAATRWLILASGVVTLIAAATGLWGISTLGAFSSGLVGLDALESYDAVSLLLAGLTSLITIGAGVCWLIWQHRAASSVPPASLRRSPGWHVGSWFIPVVAWWFPFQNVKDIVRGSNAPVSGGLLGGWWALWIASSLTYVASTNMTNAADTVPALTAALNVSLVGDVLWIAAAALAWIVVKRVTDALDPGIR